MKPHPAYHEPLLAVHDVMEISDERARVALSRLEGVLDAADNSEVDVFLNGRGMISGMAAVRSPSAR